MPSRTDMDRPAAVAALVLGVALIAISVPFLSSSEEGATVFTITWAQEVYGTESQPSGAANAETTVTVSVQGRHPSNATISFDPCTDGATPPLQSPAAITWTLKEGATVLRENQLASCASNGPFVVPLHGHPDIGQQEGGNATEAAEAAQSYDRTTVYTLTFRWSRPAGATSPIPLPPPPFATTGELEVQAWNAIANDPDAEVPR